MSLAQKGRGGFAEMWQVDAEVELKLTFSPWFLGMWLAFIPAQTVLILSCCSWLMCALGKKNILQILEIARYLLYSDSDLASPVLERCTKVSKKKIKKILQTHFELVCGLKYRVCTRTLPAQEPYLGKWAGFCILRNMFIPQHIEIPSYLSPLLSCHMLNKLLIPSK